MSLSLTTVARAPSRPTRPARAAPRLAAPRAFAPDAAPAPMPELAAETRAAPSGPAAIARALAARLGIAAPELRDAPELRAAPAPRRARLAFADFLSAIRAGDVAHVVLPPPDDAPATSLLAIRRDGTEAVVSVPPDASLMRYLDASEVPMTVASAGTGAPNGVLKAAQSIVTFACEIALMYAIGAVIFRAIGGGRGFGGLGKNPFLNKIGGDGELQAEDATGVTFAEVAGADNAKNDLAEIVDFLKRPEKYATVGAKIPRGVLLYGPPGCGKTLLARAIAGEAGVPFFNCSGSEFIEMFVGVGASRVRELFAKAKEKAPCIVFVDEIDAVGRARGGNVPGTGSNDERDQTINQLLTAMDGFTPNAGVIVIAATNRPDILDPALLRPGRFDRRVAVELPDFKGRAEILAVHTRTRPISPEVSLTAYARVTVGFSGADLENLCNEAAIYAARADRTAIAPQDLDNAFEKVVLGEARRNIVVTEKKKRVLAFHEAGHALMSMLVGEYDLCRKVSIVPRGRTGGATYFEPDDERLDLSLVSRAYLEAKILVAYGGRVAEELVFGTMNVTTGASGDLQEVYRISYQMIAGFGFNERAGKVGWTEAVGAGTASAGPDSEIGSEIRLLAKFLYERARQLLSENEFYLHRIAEELMERETLTQEDLLRLTQGMVCVKRRESATGGPPIPAPTLADSSYEETGGADH